MNSLFPNLLDWNYNNYVVHPHLTELLSIILFTELLRPVIDVLSVFHYFLGNFSNFSLHKITPWTSKNIFKKQFAKSVLPCTRDVVIKGNRDSFISISQEKEDDRHVINIRALLITVQKFSSRVQNKWATFNINWSTINVMQSGSWEQMNCSNMHPVLFTSWSGVTSTSLSCRQLARLYSKAI